MIDAAIPPTVVRTLKERYDITQAIPVSGGMSGAVVYRCVANTNDSNEQQQQFALRQWPAGVDVARVAEVAGVVACARRRGGWFLPKSFPMGAGGNAFEVVHDKADRAVWELTSWVDGQPLSPDAPVPMITAGAAAIGAFHQAVAALTSQHQRAPAVTARIKRANEIDALMPRLLSVSPRDFTRQYSGGFLIGDAPPELDAGRMLADALGRARDQLQIKWASVHQDFTRSIRGPLGDKMVTQYVLRDIHREHLLFTGQQVSGMIDFDAIRVDTPLADLVRWGGGFLRNRQNADEIWDGILAGHQRESTSLQGCTPDQFRRLAGELHCISTWISLANWLVWLTIDQRSFDADPTKLAKRIDELADLAAEDL